MNMRTSLLVVMLALGLAACIPNSPPRGSGWLDSSSYNNPFFYPDLYSRPYSSAYASRWVTSDCAPVDTNCTFLYDSPGGGETKP